MGPVHGDEDEDHMKETTEATKNLQNSVTADVKQLKEPLNKMMKVAKFRAKEDVACLQGEFSKLEQVLNKLDSPEVDDVLAPHKHYFTHKHGDKFKKTIFSFDEVTEETE